MTWRITTDLIGAQRITDTSATPLHPLGTVVNATDPTYGEGAFIYLKGVASTIVGDIVSYNAYTGATTRWAGTQGSGVPLAVAMSVNLAGFYGWYQVRGNAVISVSGTVAAGDIANWSSTAVLKSAAAAGKEVLNCVAATANAVPAANFAVYTIAYPFAQGAIL